MSIDFANIKDAALGMFEETGKDLVDQIVGHYKDVGEDKKELGEKFAKLLVANGKELIAGDITREVHDENVEALWNAQKSDVLATAYEEKVTIIGMLVNSVSVLAKMGGGLLSKLLG